MSLSHHMTAFLSEVRYKLSQEEWENIQSQDLIQSLSSQLTVLKNDYDSHKRELVSLGEECSKIREKIRDYRRQMCEGYEELSRTELKIS
jgi:predicted  nucleic acid-binding Zn-ribbon protein